VVAVAAQEFLRQLLSLPLMLMVPQAFKARLPVCLFGMVQVVVVVVMVVQVVLLGRLVLALVVQTQLHLVLVQQIPEVVAVVVV
jgi:hypothetical protein